MTILIDASALVAMAVKEEDARALAARLDEHDDRLYCPTGEWEAVLAIARKRTLSLGDARGELGILIDRLELRPVAIGAREALIAIDAAARYGKGTGHPAQLNMGDCFAYACAKAHGARLLYKRNDFSQTDLG
ncbi:type II toxin-antitoxin system VapC family toxin [Sphingomonas sp. NPDC079357]|uniref:type II toxin-antitoxin system VapC family toxin n=1 Tax=Sphingomonas sp. NPDC079357 TaxID=3364518 RepID=UPI00384B3D7E